VREALAGRDVGVVHADRATYDDMVEGHVRNLKEVSTGSHHSVLAHVLELIIASCLVTGARLVLVRKWLVKGSHVPNPCLLIGRGWRVESYHPTADY
jgi:hypothetical protein